MEISLLTGSDCQLTTGDLRLSGRWQQHYRYREMEISLLTGSDCQLTTERSAPQWPLATALSVS
ncbi:hypothetical protein ACLHZ5_21460 [Aeromonas media]|uniref:hypothetical protein n=1 Tax=Aeromonas media TaxID=651 RepID=UPI003D08B9D6